MESEGRSWIVLGIKDWILVRTEECKRKLGEGWRGEATLKNISKVRKVARKAKMSMNNETESILQQ